MSPSGGSSIKLIDALSRNSSQCVLGHSPLLPAIYNFTNTITLSDAYAAAVATVATATIGNP